MSSSSPPPAVPPSLLRLERFLPYRLSIASNRVSDLVAEAYCAAVRAEHPAMARDRGARGRHAAHPARDRRADGDGQDDGQPRGAAAGRARRDRSRAACRRQALAAARRSVTPGARSTKASHPPRWRWRRRCSTAFRARNRDARGRARQARGGDRAAQSEAEVVGVATAAGAGAVVAGRGTAIGPPRGRIEQGGGLDLVERGRGRQDSGGRATIHLSAA